jgi:hypothetical protein
MEAKEMRLVDGALYNRIMNLAKKLSQNATHPQDGENRGVSFNNTVSKTELNPENLEPNFDAAKHLPKEKNTQIQDKFPEVEKHILESFPPRIISRVKRIFNFIQLCERIDFNKKYQLIMDGKLYENSNIIDNLSDMLYPIKSLPTIDQQLFYAILNECNMPQSYISNPYRKRLQMEGHLFEKTQNEEQERYTPNRKYKSSRHTKEINNKKVKKAKGFSKQTKQKSKLNKIAQGWLSY